MHHLLRCVPLFFFILQHAQHKYTQKDLNTCVSKTVKSFPLTSCNAYNFKNVSQMPRYLSWWKSPWNIFRSTWVCVGRPPTVQWSKQCGLPSHSYTQTGVSVGEGRVRWRTKQRTNWWELIQSFTHPERREERGKEPQWPRLDSTTITIT